MTEYSNADWKRLIKQQELVALEKLWNHVGIVAWKIARRYGQSEEIKDISREAALQAMRRILAHIDDYKEEGAFLGFCYIIVKREVLRLGVKLPPEPLNLEEVVATISPTPPLLDLQTCLTKLDRRAQQIIRLFYFEGYTPEEIGMLLNIKRNHVAQILYDARQKLKQCLQNGGYGSAAAVIGA